MSDSARYGLKRLYFDRIFLRAYWTWRKHPTIIIPTMLGTAINVIEQSIVTLAIILFLVDLSARGILPQFLAQLGRNSILSVLQNPSYGVELVLILFLTIASLIIVAVVGGGWALSSEYGTYKEAWMASSVSAGSVVENGSRRWKAMAWTIIVFYILTWGPAAVGYSLLLLSLFNATSLSGLFAVLVSSVLAEIAILTSLAISIFTVYSFAAVVVDNVSGLGAIRQSFRVAGRNLGTTITYGIVRTIFQAFLTILVLISLVPGIGVPLTSLVSVILSFLLTPILHSTKTMIYAYASPSEPEMPFQLAQPIWFDIVRRLPKAAWSKVQIGLREIAHFLLAPRNLPYHAASTLAFVAGIAAGDYVSSRGLVSYLGIQPGRINPAVTQVFGPALGIDIFLHNWLVSIATALAGIGFGLPSFATIMFNGFILGLLIPAFPNPTLLWGGILPHGIIEIPSFVLSGSIGLKLGYAAWKAKLHPVPQNSANLSAVLRQAVYIVVGLALLFLIAGIIEGNVTPVILRMLGAH